MQVYNNLATIPTLYATYSVAEASSIYGLAIAEDRLYVAGDGTLYLLSLPSGKKAKVSGITNEPRAVAAGPSGEAYLTVPTGTPPSGSPCKVQRVDFAVSVRIIL